MVQEKYINLAAFTPGSNALGPGQRAVIWVQGCPFSCEGCISADWRSFDSKEQISVKEMAKKICSLPGIDGLTISGGEPFAQPEALADLLGIIRKKRKLSVICFTGFLFKDLVKNLDQPGFNELLEQIDLLIDGPFMQNLTQEKGLRGSSNQRFFHLTDMLIDFNPAEMERNLEILVQPGSLMLVGIPSSRDLVSFEKTVSRVNQELLQSGFMHQGLQV